jgi:ribokinase
MGKIVVVGSMSMDFIVETKIVPAEGETVIGEKFSVLFGGKGANQAIASARLGNETIMIGCVGTDPYGDMVISNFQQNNVNTSCIEKREGTTGSAHITLQNGENRIIIVEGANAKVKPEIIEKYGEVLKEADLIILQQEIPEETVKAVIDYCSERGIKTLLNPAPARPISEFYLKKLDYIIPNEHEFSVTFNGMNQEDALALYSNRLIITLGSKGAIYHDGNKEIIVPAQKCDVVDTTGAGDCFVAAFSDGVLRGYSLTDSIHRACMASGIAIGKLGAQPGLPTIEELESQIKKV